MATADWSNYVAGFHADRPGVTERVLHRARSSGEDAYDWLAAAAAKGRVVLDLACGSAPLLPVLAAGRHVGVDVSAAELALARRRGAGLLVRGSASALPLADGSVEVVACSMALQILTPLPTVLAEVARVLTPGGRLVATVPDSGPLRARDVPIIAALLATLGRGLGYPNDRLLRRLPDLLAVAGLRLVTDDRRRFAYPLATAADAEVFLASLYLPGLSARRYRAARVLLRAAARPRLSLPVPVRRLVAVRS
jgi:SAM-dependent methyltransferase